MDHGKIDAALSSALDESTAKDVANLEVFVRAKTPLSPNQASELKALGAQGAIVGKSLVTAKVSPHAVEHMTECSWVQSVKLSRKLRAMESAEDS